MADSTTSQIINNAVTLTNNLGKAVLHNLYPVDFEFYMIAFELVDADNKTVDYLIFPVNPKNVREEHTNLENIERTAGGMVSLNSSLFQPVNININGDFGRRFKFLVGRENLNMIAMSYNGERINEFSKQIKTGYGVIKILENMVSMSKTIDVKSRPYKMYFYNHITGNSYLVKKIVFSCEQSFPSSNMIHNYSISMVGVAPVNSFTKKDSAKALSNMTIQSVLMNGVNKLSRTISNNINSYEQGRKINNLPSYGGS
jgi:hypothetical protein